MANGPTQRRYFSGSDRTPFTLHGKQYSGTINAYNAGALERVTDPAGVKHYYDPKTQAFGGFDMNPRRGGFMGKSGRGQDGTDRTYRMITNPTQATTPAPEEPGQAEQTPAESLEDRSAAQKAEIDDYFDQKMSEAEQIIAQPPTGPTAVDQGATVRDLQIASEGDDALAMSNTTTVGIGALTRQRRRQSLLSIPTY